MSVDSFASQSSAQLPELPEALQQYLDSSSEWHANTMGDSGASLWKSSQQVLKIQERCDILISQLWDERQRLAWLSERVAVPQIITYQKTSTHEYLLMTRLQGSDLAQAEALERPQQVVELLAQALQQLHAVSIADCPYNMSIPVRLREARERVAADMIPQSELTDPTRNATEVLRELLQTRPQQEDFVLTHGDACLPNFIVAEGELKGMIDLGRAGIADRHADLALTYRSLVRNIDTLHAEKFLELYGRQYVNEDKMQYFALLDELS